MTRNFIKTLPLFLALILTLLGGMVILGWYSHSQILIQVSPTFAPMQYNTALGFFLCGLSLIAYYLKQQMAAKILSLLVLLLGVATLFQYIFDFDLGIDELFVDPVFITKTSHPGRMAPITAICFILSALGLFSIKRKRSLVVSLSLAVFAFSAFASLSYLITVNDGIYGWGTLTRMAIHTASGFILLGIALFIYGLWGWSKKPFDFWYITPFSIATIISVFSVFAWYTIQEEARTHNLEYFDNLVSDSESILQDRYDLYEQSLFGGLGLYYASASVERQEWKNYIDALKVKERLPGINGIGYIDYVTEQNLPAYLEQTRMDDFPNFRNHPETTYKDKFIIKFIEPVEDNIEAVGLDIGFEKNRRTAAERARDLGVPALTKKILLVQDQKKQPGFLMLIPIYETHDIPATLDLRRAHLQGWVYAPFIGANFLNGINNISGNQLDFAVYDGEQTAADDLIYMNTDKFSNLFTGLTKKTKFEIAGRVWTIQWTPNSTFTPPANQNLGLIILIFGIIFACFIYFTLNKLLHSKDTIKKKVDEQTKKLTHANEELEEFAYRTSHDLRSPLISSIALLGMANEALDKKQYDFVRESMGHTKDSLQRLEDLVKDILTLTKVKNIEEDPQDVDIKLIIDTALNKFAYMDNYERLDIQQDLNFKEGLVVKKVRLVLIIENLLSNAIKYQDTKKETSYINVSTYKEKNHFVFTIKDNGLGIPEEHQKNLFKMFKRFHANTSFGSGLGLYMIKKSADILHGQLLFEDNNGETIFTLKIPLAS